MKHLFILILFVGVSGGLYSQVDSSVKKVEQLQQVEVRAKRPLLEHHIDRTVVNVQTMISASTSNTLEVLERIPGVSVDRNGEISLNGRSGVIVLIDNKTMYLPAQELGAYLRSLPGGSVDKIELMDNPPARYDANGAAVIHIKLIKNKKLGATGSISTAYTQGRYARTNNNINVSFNKNPISIYVNAGFNSEKAFNTDVFDRSFFNSENELTGTVDLYNRHMYKGTGINVNAGVDYTISKNTTAGISVNLHDGKRRGWFNYTSESFNSEQVKDAIVFGTTTGVDNRKQTGINLNILHKIKDNSELSADVNFFRNNGFGDRAMNNIYYDGLTNIDSTNYFTYVMPTAADIYAARTDYVHNFQNNAKIEVGLKTSIIINENVNDHFDVNASEKVKDFRRSNHFKYRENINAAYANANKTWGRVGLQAGLRLENTNSKGIQYGNAVVERSEFERSYNGLYPSLFINYKLDSAGARSFVFSFNKRLSRPNYQSLNPFVYFRDQYSLTSGNPLLGVQNQYRYEMKYQHKQWFWTALSFNRFNDVILNTTEAQGELFITRPQNIGKGYMVILNTGFNVPVTGWWQMNSTVRLARLGLRGMTYDELLNVDANVARLDVMNFFKMGKKVNAELGGYYASRDLNGQSVTKGMYRVNAALQMKVLKEKGSIKLSVDDMFRTWVYRNNSIGLKQAKFYQESYSDTQRFGVAFSFQFGKENTSRKRRDVSGEERERL